MPTCAFCGCDEFNEVEGFLYCADCDKQASQGRTVLHESYVGQEVQGGRGGGDIEAEKEPTKQPQSKGRVFYADGGVPWVVPEALALVFKFQIQRLIANGAGPSLKSWAYRLWSLYLSKLGLAFIDDPFNLALPYFNLQPRGRDFMPPTTDNPWVLENVLLWRRTSALTGSHSFDTEKVVADEELPEEETVPTQKLELDAKKMRLSKSGAPYKKEHRIFVSDTVNTEIENEEIEFGDMITGSFAKTYPEIDHAKRKYCKVKWHVYASKYSKQKRQSKLSSSFLSSNPFRWVPTKMLCLVYLALSISGHYVTPALVLRYANLGLIPFRDMRECLPPEIVMQTQDDLRLFTGRVPLLNSFTVAIRYLADFLEIDTLPLPPFELVVANCLESLFLPKDLYNYVVSFIERVPVCRVDKRVDYKYVVDYDSVALAYVLVVLKVVLAIDDNECQRVITHSRAKLSGFLPEVNLFEFAKWLRLLESYAAVSQRSAADLSKVLSEKQSSKDPVTEPRKDLLSNKMPLYERARNELLALLGDVQANLGSELASSSKVQTENVDETKVKLQELRNSRSAYFGVNSCSDLMQAMNLQNSLVEQRIVANGLSNSIDSSLRQIQSALSKSETSTQPFARKSLEAVAEIAPLYTRILKIACDIVVPSVALQVNLVHKLVCDIEVETTGCPTLFMPKYSVVRRKHFHT